MYMYKYVIFRIIRVWEDIDDVFLHLVVYSSTPGFNGFLQAKITIRNMILSSNIIHVDMYHSCNGILHTRDKSLYTCSKAMILFACQYYKEWLIPLICLVVVIVTDIFWWSNLSECSLWAIRHFVLFDMLWHYFSIIGQLETIDWSAIITMAISKVN